MDSITDQQVIAALIAAPAETTATAVDRLEPDDFNTWIHRTIYTEGLLKCALADHPEPGSIIIQINRHLLAAGLYRDTDNGLRAAVTDLAGITGHPEQLPTLVDELLEQRYRREVGDFALAAAQHAQDSPLADMDHSLTGIHEIRRLRLRLADFANVAHLERKGA